MTAKIEAAVPEAVETGQASENDGSSSRRIMAERIAAALLSAFAALVLFASINLGLFKGTQPGPGLFPLVVSSLLLLLGILWFVFLPGLHGRHAAAPPDSVSPAQTGISEQPAELVAHESAVFGTELVEAVGEAGGIAEIEEAVAEQEPGDLPPIDREGSLRIAFILFWSLIPILLMERVGFLLSMIPYVSVMIIVIARRKWWKVVLITAVAVLLVQVGTSFIGLALPDPFRIISTIRFW
ncbi:MAG: tripartite tricarboxylate transporter TctB family protein [Propionibacteriaceae bacterium]|jgi:hypothetical protein|nr:tripartite tricarboxylate transporter TctB family protein [Propionibacteriaceae bacterium]